MDTLRSLSRRRLLDGVASLVVLGSLAGCSDGSNTGDGSDGGNGGDEPESDDEGAADDDGSGDEDSDDDSGEDGSDGSDDNGDDDDTDDDSGDDGDDGSGTGELDLREANVVGVTFDRDDGRYTFDVTLHHDDDGEEGYANWWQVERLDGTQLGRRELLHAHSRQPFTRSGTIEIPDGVGCVVVRGHDETHGYGGRATLVNVGSGATRSIDQGTDRQSFTRNDCPEGDG